MNMERPVLVTGSSGFIGQALVAALVAQGRRVRALVRRAEAAQQVERLGAEAMVGDLLDKDVVKRAACGAGAVFHLAGRLFRPGVPAGEYARLHVDATLGLLEGCSGAGSSGGLDYFVLCSTTGVHGPTGSRPAREDDAGNPQNAYERSKAEAEGAATALAVRKNLPLVIARPGLVYGPGDRHLLGWFRAIRSGYYRVIGHGQNHLHPIYIDDAVKGLELCAAARRDTPGRTYHLVGPEAVTIRDLSDAIGRSVGRAVPQGRLPVPVASAIGAMFETLPVPRRVLPLTRSRVRFLTQNRAYDGARAREDLGFVPRIGLDEGLRRTVGWYREQGLL